MSKTPTPHSGGAERPPPGKAGVPFGAIDVAPEEKVGRVRAVFDSVAPRYDLMNDLMSGGLHRFWKTAAVDWLAPQPGYRIIDVAGGTGDVAMRLVRAAGGAEALARTGGAVTVIDINTEMMAVGHNRVAARGLDDAIAFACANAEALPLEDASVDTYVIAFGLRNVTRPERALAEAFRVLVPGGRFLCLEFSRPRWPLLGPVYARYSDHVLPWLGEHVAGDGPAYRYLVDSIRRFPDQDTLAAMMAEAGFEQVRVRDLSGGIAAMHSGWRL